MKLGTIEQEAAACRKAFKGVGVGALAWCVHHETLCERLIEPSKNRIDYILTEKPKEERARRLREMRPVLGKVPAAISKARAAHAYDAYDAYDAYAAYAAYAKAYADHRVELESLHRAECPDSTWDGTTIFGEVKG